ncbi:MAG: hypothetical protein ACYTFZ_11270, partial [Planctomycetota bacterium]
KADIRPKEQAGQPEADAGKQARSDLTAIIFDSDDQPLLGAGIHLCDAARDRPEEFRRLTNRFNRNGVVLGLLIPDTTAEFLLLDAAVDAYWHWMDLTALTRSTYQDGTGTETSKYQVRMAATAQSYLKTFTEMLKALRDMKTPPIRILQIRAGENVAVQINEKTKVLEARHVPALPAEGERRGAVECAPAAEEAAGEDPD